MKLSAASAPSSTEAFLRLTGAGIRRQTFDRFLGWIWWLIDPLVMIGVYALVFGGWLGVGRESAGGTYPLFLACALIPWRWFSQATSRGANALTQNAAILTSLPVNRGSIVLSETAAASLPSLAGFAILAVFAIGYDRPLTVNLVWLPIPLLVMGVLTFAVAFILCPLVVILPDLGNLWAVLLRVAWFLSPGLYRVERIPDAYRELYSILNPMVGILEGIRRPIHDGLPPLWEPLAYSAAWAVALLFVGRFIYRRTVERSIRLL